MSETEENLLWPVFEFRTLPERRLELFRYADGLWLPDDGEYDVAFYGDSIAYYVHLPHQRNIIWQWLDGHWSSNEHRHPRSNPWHYALRDGETAWGGDWGQRSHPNHVIGEKAMSRCSSVYRCANGRGPEVTADSPYIAQGLVRNRETKEVVRPPGNAHCMYCGDAAPHLRCEALSA